MTRKTQTLDAPPQAALRDPFDAIPVVADGVQARCDAQTPVQLRRELEPGRGLAGFLARRLGFRRQIRVNLEERGSWCWGLIDGVSSLGEIERRVRERFSLEEDESKKAIILFVRMLMTRHLIWLKIPQSDKPPVNRGTR